MHAMTSEQASFLLEIVCLPWRRSTGSHEDDRSGPVDQGGYRPAENSMSAMDLAWHIAVGRKHVPGRSGFGGVRIRREAAGIGARRPPMWRSGIARPSPANLDKIRKMTGEQLNRPVDFRGMFQWPAVTVPAVRDEPLDPSPRPVIGLSPADGGEGAVDLRLQLRRVACAKGCSAVELAGLEPRYISRAATAPNWLTTAIRLSISASMAGEWPAPRRGRRISQ